MTQWLTNASPIVSYAIGALAFMAGSILFLGAFFLKPGKKERSGILPSMRAQAGTIPSNYAAKESIASSEVRGRG
jgi:hypothetical protein